MEVRCYKCDAPEWRAAFCESRPCGFDEMPESGYALHCILCGFYLFCLDGGKLQSMLDLAWKHHNEAHPECEGSEPMERVPADVFREYLATCFDQEALN